METKPYALQSPEAIAKEYGGNKQKIAQAAQIGLLDPTAAVLAGMFIDRMRGAQSQEQAPQSTVAQQVLAPQPAAPAGAGLGATPEASQLAAAYPAEGAPPPIPGPSMPQEPVMAADGGLMSLPVDDAMFQPSYNSGGIVAFATGSDDKPVQGEGVIAERERERLRRVIQERAAAITDPTARAQFLNQITKLSPDEQRQALGEITLNPIPLPPVFEARDMREVQGEGFGGVDRPSNARGVIDAQAASTAVAPAAADRSSAPDPAEEIRREFGDEAAQFYKEKGFFAPTAWRRLSDGESPTLMVGKPPVSDVYPDETLRGSRASMVAPSADAPAAVAPADVATRSVAPAPADATAAPAVQDRGPTANTAFGLRIPGVATTNRADILYPTPNFPTARVADAAIAADPQAAEAATKQGGAAGLSAYVDQYKQLLGAVPEGEGLKEYKEYLKNLPGELDKRKKEDLWGALTQFGLNLAGSQSPYFLQAAGQAGAQTMPAITGAIKERRGAEAEARKSRAELDKMTRAEEIKALEGGVKLYGDEQGRLNQAEIARLNREAQLQAARMAADKPTDMRSYVADAVAAARAAGDNQTPEPVLRQRAVETYLNLYGAAGARASAAQSQATTAADAASARIQDSARDNVDKALAGNWNSTENKRIRDLQKADREANKTSGAKPGDANYQDSVTPYKNSLYSSEENRLRRGSAAPAPAPDASARPPAPAPAPAASAGRTIPAAAISDLKRNPSELAKKQFDEVFGAGAAARVLGK
jgi:hypothetical protein